MMWLQFHDRNSPWTKSPCRFFHPDRSCLNARLYTSAAATSCPADKHQVWFWAVLMVVVGDGSCLVLVGEQHKAGCVPHQRTLCSWTEWQCINSSLGMSSPSSLRLVLGSALFFPGHQVEHGREGKVETEMEVLWGVWRCKARWFILYQSQSESLPLLVWLWGCIDSTFLSGFWSPSPFYLTLPKHWVLNLGRRKWKKKSYATGHWIPEMLKVLFLLLHAFEKMYFQYFVLELLLEFWSPGIFSKSSP